MKVSVISTLAVASAFQCASAHYLFNRVVVNGAMQPAWRYFREHTNTYTPTKGNDITIDSFRCNKGAFLNPNSEVLSVAAGGQVTIRLSTSTPTVTHPGPVHIFMSKAPGDVRQYDGSGDWFKVYQNDICGSTSDGVQDTDWCSWQKSDFPFTIPSATPPGDYLVRIEQIGLHGAHVSGGAEVFFGCLQVRVTGNGNGTPGPLVKIPGVYKFNSLDFNKYTTFYSYPHPAPAVWNGAGGSTSPNPTTTRTTTRAATTTNAPSTGVTVPKFGQCGGIGYTGPTSCAAGSTCTKSNDYYSQCL